MDNQKEKLVDVLSKSIPYGYGTLCLIADELTANGVCLQEKQSKSDAASEWISVKDRLPEIGELVLTALDDGFVDSNYLEGNNTWGFEYDSPITHWMPRPQPPKGE